MVVGRYDCVVDPVPIEEENEDQEGETCTSHDENEGGLDLQDDREDDQCEDDPRVKDSSKAEASQGRSRRRRRVEGEGAEVSVKCSLGQGIAMDSI